MTWPMVLPAAMMLAGSVHWERSASPVLVLGCVVLGWWLVLGVAALLVGRWLRIPTAIAAAALTVAAFTVDAALGAPMQPGSLLNSRPIYGLRWYGFGNVTFAAYATNGLLLAGYVAHRLITGGRQRLALVGVAAIGFGVIICEGWPSMGTDFGGVIALTPAVLWLLFSLSGVRLTGPKLLLIAGSAVLVIGAISFLDWRAGPRSAQSPRQLRAADHRRRCAGRGRAEGRRLGRDDHQPARHRFAGHRHPALDPDLPLCAARAGTGVHHLAPVPAVDSDHRRSGHPAERRREQRVAHRSLRW